MSIVYTDNQYYQDIADAIRAKNGSSDTYLPSEMAAAIEDISGGGGASNFVTGTFTTGSAQKTREIVTVPYTGSGYPLVLVIYVDGGLGSGTTDFGKSLVRYAIGQFVICKYRPDYVPTYDETGLENYGSYALTYKNSTTSASTYAIAGAATANSYSSAYATGARATAVRWLQGNKISYYTAGGTSSTYGLLPSTTYHYYAVFSS